MLPPLPFPLPGAVIRRRLLTVSATLGLLWATGASSLAQSPIVEVRFNDPVDLVLQNGAALGPDTSGCSGKPGDKGLSINAPEPVSGQRGPAVVIADAAAVASGLDELTVVAWYRSRGGIANDSVLLDAVGAVFIWEQKTGQWVLRINTKPPGDDKPSMYWFGTGRQAPLGTWDDADRWTFIAAVWKKSDKKVTFYQGDPNTPSAVAREATRPEDVASMDERAKTPRVIGNTASQKIDRPFNGSVDNVRIYGQALSAAAIEKVRAADAKNQPVTLP